MSRQRQIVIFSAGCPACDEAVQTVNKIACPSCEVRVLDMHEPGVAAQAKRYGVSSVPAVSVDGKLADCCAGDDEASLRAAGVGVPLP